MRRRAFGQLGSAERSAVVSAVSGGFRNFTSIAVATENGGAPCGSCRQVLREFGLILDVYLVDEQDKVKEYKLADLLPMSFSSEDLKK